MKYGQKAKELIDSYLESRKNEVRSLVDLAAVYGALGEIDIAFRYPDEAFSKRDRLIPILKVEPKFVPLTNGRSHRFKSYIAHHVLSTT